MKNLRFISLLLVLVMLSSALLISCGGGAEAGQYDDAKALYEAGKYEEAQAAFEAIKDYEDSKDWVKKCRTAILDAKYNDAVAKLEAGNIVEAYEALIALDGHKDSVDKAAGIADQYKAEKMKNAKAGDVVTFGRYEQDNVLDNGTEDIEWIVLEVKDGKALLISKYVLDFKKYKEASPHSWANSEVRTFLNGAFYNEVFNIEEVEKIQTPTLSPDQTQEFSVSKVSAKDKVFLLDITETMTYFRGENERKCEMTAFAKANSPQPNQNSNLSEWLLRVVTEDQKNPYVVGIAGDISTHSGRLINGVRPAIWINLGA